MVLYITIHTYSAYREGVFATLVSVSHNRLEHMVHQPVPCAAGRYVLFLMLVTVTSYTFLLSLLILQL